MASSGFICGLFRIRNCDGSFLKGPAFPISTSTNICTVIKPCKIKISHVFHAFKRTHTVIAKLFKMHDVLLIFWQCRNLSVAPAKIDIEVPFQSSTNCVFSKIVSKILLQGTWEHHLFLMMFLKPKEGYVYTSTRGKTT